MPTNNTDLIAVAADGEVEYTMEVSGTASRMDYAGGDYDAEHDDQISQTTQGVRISGSTGAANAGSKMYGDSFVVDGTVTSFSLTNIAAFETEVVVNGNVMSVSQFKNEFVEQPSQDPPSDGNGGDTGGDTGGNGGFLGDMSQKKVAAGMVAAAIFISKPWE